MSIAVSLVLIGSLVLSFYFLWQTTKNKDEQKSDMLKVGIPLLIPLIAFIFPLFEPKAVTQIIVPELEEKIEENKKLKSEVQELNELIASKDKEQKNASAKIKELNEKNYAELSKAALIQDGLEKKDVKGSVALVNNKTYYEENMLNDLLGESITYNPEEKKIYIGSEEKITKQSLSEVYSILYNGENMESLNDAKEEYKVAGKFIDNGFVLGSSKFYEKGSYALMNVDGKYSTIEFDVGCIDGKYGSGKDGKLKIELDGEKKDGGLVEGDIATKHYSFDISGAKTLKINMLDSESNFGFYNVVFQK